MEERAKLQAEGLATPPPSLLGPLPDANKMTPQEGFDYTSNSAWSSLDEAPMSGDMFLHQGGFASVTAKAGQAFPLDNKLDLPHDEGSAADVFGLDNLSFRATRPVFHRQAIQAAMRPTKARLLSCPGRGPVPLPISVHPKARPFGVAYSSLALRAAAKFRAEDPSARLLISARHPLPAKPELCLPQGFEMPKRLPSPATAVALLAQANRAQQRYLKLTKQLDDSTYVPPAVFGESVTATGTAGDFSKYHPLINPRAEANPRIPDDVPSLEAARAALEEIQTERMATLGSVSEPLACAQEQPAAHAASLGKDNARPLCYGTQHHQAGTNGA